MPDGPSHAPAHTGCVPEDTLSPKFRALADPKRRYFLECLRDGDARLFEFYEIFPLSVPTVIHHLRVLEESGLVLSQKEGPMRIYSLLPEGLKEAETWLRRCWLRDPEAQRRPPIPD